MAKNLQKFIFGALISTKIVLEVKRIFLVLPMGLVKIKERAPILHYLIAVTLRLFILGKFERHCREIFQFFGGF